MAIGDLSVMAIGDLSVMAIGDLSVMAIGDLSVIYRLNCKGIVISKDSPKIGRYMAFVGLSHCH
jgi:hypothetical protein